MNYNQKLKLDIRDNHTYEQLYTKQSDKGYPLIFEITKDAQPFDLTGASARLQLMKPDGNVVLTDCTISNNLVTVELTEQMTAVPGKCPFEIALTDSNQRITTISGIMKVDKSAVDDGVISESVIQIIIRAIDAADQAVAAASDAYNSAQSASTHATNAHTSELHAKASEDNAKLSEDNAKTSEDNAKTSEENAKDSEDNAKDSEDNAKISETNAKDSEDNAKDSEDQALFYYQECQRIERELGDVIVPMGTIYFADLANEPKVAGHMYTIIDAFVTDNTFVDGGGTNVPAGSNVYCTAALLWDTFNASGVSGVKGNAEVQYRHGNVNITPANIGLGNVENKSSADIRGELTKQNVTDALGFTPLTIAYSTTEPTTQNEGDWWFEPYNI